MTADLPSPTFDNSRDAEAALVLRCVQAARGEVVAAVDAREAGVFTLAARVLTAPALVQSLRTAAAAFPVENRSTGELLSCGPVANLARFRLMLERALS